MLFGLGVALESEADYERRYIVLPHVLLLFRFYGLHYETFGIPSSLHFFFFLSFLLFSMLLYSRISARVVIHVIYVWKEDAKRLLVYTSPFVRAHFAQGYAREGEHD